MKITPTTLILAAAAAAGIYFALKQNPSSKDSTDILTPASTRVAKDKAAAPAVAIAPTPTATPPVAPTITPAGTPAAPASPMTDGNPPPAAPVSPEVAAGTQPPLSPASPVVPTATSPASPVVTPLAPGGAPVASAPQPMTPVDPNAATAPQPATTGTDTASAVSAPAVAPAPAPGPVSAVGNGDNAPVAKNQIRMNFQGASLNDVLNYLSDAAGFIVIQDTPVNGTVNIISKQPMSANEAVDLLNTVLISKGYTAILNGRVLKIVSSHDALKNDLPVITTSDPDQIPKKDVMVTQILPIRYVEATKLIANLTPLLSSDASISSNENSNAIILTDTQKNIHRIAEIIHALDNSISSISSIHVFQLRYADAKEFATVLTQLFNPDQAGGNNRNGQQNVPPFMRQFGGGGGRGGGGGQPAEPESEARKAASRVVAVPDTQSNSVVVSAPEEYMATITDVVERLDVSTTEVTETRIFRLEHADCQELSVVLNSIYGDTTTTSSAGNQNRGGNNNRGPQPQQGATVASDRQLQQARVAVAADPRTNSVIVNCSHDTMEQISLTIGRLDATDTKKQKVFVHVLEHADPDNVASILRGMFSTSQNNSNQATSTLQNRQGTGASSDISNTLNTNSSRAGGR